MKKNPIICVKAFWYDPLNQYFVDFYYIYMFKRVCFVYFCVFLLQIIFNKQSRSASQLLHCKYMEQILTVVERSLHGHSKIILSKHKLPSDFVTVS